MTLTESGISEMQTTTAGQDVMKKVLHIIRISVLF